ncbi:NAD-dependent epimerase/dehydratase [Chloroherpeton thalassium ATCC 35110]|uniref:NAD-dependent epimerase/dehydratase n=1 Tax=Chloroherpeton thalassium (strain ATCC 35110 / GB-78) TaxID=517418 RepID=B3QTE5_CHLT3|nr:NAD-dependent epimerase/dehydratase family protein [Chloroherpeton thalassium]ACF12691.1 NAD-dependent epimerase/dehydratase [Chloroherpeton thalassium ATCC 35110]
MAETALVTGATGFIGSWLTEKLLEKGYKVRALVRQSSNRANLQGLDVEYVVGDYKDFNSLKKAVQGVSYVFHTAGVTKAKAEMEYIDGNVRATESLLKATYEANPNITRFLHVSSLASVGPAKSPNEPVNEKTTAKPITMYGSSKNITEQACQRYIFFPTGKVQTRLPVTIVRPPAVYGPRDKDVLEFFKTVNSGILPIVGFGPKKLVSLIHVKDLVRGIIDAAEAEQAKGETYFISSEKFYSWEEVGEVTKKALGKGFVLKLPIPHFAVSIAAAISEATSKSGNTPPPLNREKVKDIVQNYWICSVDKAKKELGFKEQISLEQGIKETVDWYKSKGWL